MPHADSLRTERLTMRRWQPGDRIPFGALNADAEVMRHFPSTLSRSNSDALVERIEAHFDARGFGLWALEPVGGGELIGFTGLQSVPAGLPFAPATEVGWRLARRAWGQGYATEAARAALAFGFGEAKLREIVSFTTVANAASRAVMRRVGMTRDPAEDFDHPALADSPLRPHVLYRLCASRWAAAQRG